MEKTPLIKLIRRMEAPKHRGPEDDILVLPYALRRKTRQRVSLKGGREAALLLPRGITLHDGDGLISETGQFIRVAAADEPLSAAAHGDGLLLMRIAYHLGNRHVPVQIDPGRLTYRHDHVLDDMVEQLGVKPTFTKGPFDPENGAYHSHDGHEH
jgi:urease accessory protein